MTSAQRRRRLVRSEGGKLSGQRRRRALAELARRGRERKTIDFREASFPQQRALIEDRSPLVAVCCSRRAGKTWGIAYALIESARTHPWSLNVYICNTKPQAKRNIWNILQRLNAELGLAAKFNAVELSMTLRNGARIELGGCNDETEVDRYRGPTYHLVVIDEAQSVRPFFEYMIDDVFEPATLDHRGRIWIAGTPNASCFGFFYDVMKGKRPGWSLHSWTLLDNPKIEDPAGWLAERRARKGISESDPKYRREYKGEWVRDSSSLVYQITERNRIDRFMVEAADDWEFILGVDLGVVNVTAFVVMAFSVKLGQTVAVESHQLTPQHFGKDVLLLTPDHLASEITRLRARYDFAGIVVDPGDLGAKFIEDIRRRYQMPLQAAEKRSKLGAIELLNGDLQAGRLFVVESTNADLLHDASLLEKRSRMEEQDGPIDRADLVIDERSAPQHLLDAFSYAYRRCRAYLHDPEDDSPPVRSAAELEALAERERERRELEAGSSDDRPWWEQDPSTGIFRAAWRRLIEWGALLPMEAAA